MSENVTPVVRLQDLIDALDGRPENASSYLNRVTGEVYTISEDAVRIAEDGTDPRDAFPEWQQEEVELAKHISANDCCLMLPTAWDVHEWSIMLQFCGSLADDRLRSDFLAAIDGRRAFRRFKDQLAHHGLWESWNEYRRSALRAQVIEWCQAHDVPFHE